MEEVGNKAPMGDPSEAPIGARLWGTSELTCEACVLFVKRGFFVGVRSVRTHQCITPSQHVY